MDVGFYQASTAVSTDFMLGLHDKILDRFIVFVYTKTEQIGNRKIENTGKSVEREEYSQQRCDREGDSSAEKFPQRVVKGC